MSRPSQNDPFNKDYDVLDPDIGDIHTWSLMTDADWLTMNETTGVLKGTPLGDDVGTFTVNITVSEIGGLKDYRQFDLEVMDVKDKPFFTDVPTDTEVFHGAIFHFDVNATDFSSPNQFCTSCTRVTTG